MPRIKDLVLDCSIYIYKNKEDAENGSQSGGSGFICGVPCPIHDKGVYIYAVTNNHVINNIRATGSDSSFIRVNTRDGQTEIVEISLEAWIAHNDSDDIAACKFDVSGKNVKLSYIVPKDFITEKIITEKHIGIGDEVFLIGRFYGHEGRQTNIPTARFGNLAMMPKEPVRHETGLLQESFLVEIRTVSGYSGSPVFLYIPPMNFRHVGGDEYGNPAPQTYLLGVHWGHLHEKARVTNKDGKWMPVDESKEDKWLVNLNSGMGMVVPAWKLQELLNQDELVDVIEAHVKASIDNH